jgi:oxygen-dependent protoporphyrinogen oxidase
MARPLQTHDQVIRPSPLRKPFPRLAVLGGGISGLGCAFWLSELLPFAQVVVFEASDRLGGVIRSVREGDYLLESGPLSFPSGAPATGALLRQAGLEKDCSPALSPLGIGLWNGRTITPAPRTPLDMLLCKLLSPAARVRLFAEPFIPQSARGEDLSILEFFRRRTGDGFFESLMEPMSAGILAGDPAVLSMSANLPRFHAMEQKSGSLARGFWEERLRKPPARPRPTSELPESATTPAGCGALIEALAGELRHRGVTLRTACGAKALRSRPGGFLLRSGSGPEDKEEEFDGVVSALPSPALAAMEAEWPAGVREFLEGIPHVPLRLVYLAFPKADRRSRVACDGLLPQPKAGEDFLSGFLPSRIASGRCPADQDLLRLLMGGARKPHLAQLEDAQIEAVAVRSARRVFGMAGNPVFVRAIRHERGLPQLLVGHLQALGRAQAALRRTLPGFFLAGTSFQGPGIENAIRSGRVAAVEAAAHFVSEAGEGRNLHDTA